jgi:hypothetical protein
MPPPNVPVRDPVSVRDAAHLPGAIFILTVTPTKPSSSAPATDNPVAPGQTSSSKPKHDKPYTVVAYDPEIKPKSKFSAHVDRYERERFPYFEDFSDSVANFGPEDYYSKYITTSTFRRCVIVVLIDPIARWSIRTEQSRSQYRVAMDRQGKGKMRHHQGLLYISLEPEQGRQRFVHGCRWTTIRP